METRFNIVLGCANYYSNGNEDVTYVEKIMNKMWVKEWNVREQPEVVQWSISRIERNRRDHSVTGNRLSIYRDLLWYVEGKTKGKMWMMEWDTNESLKNLDGTVSCKEHNRRAYFDIVNTLPSTRDHSGYLSKSYFIFQFVIYIKEIEAKLSMNEWNGSGSSKIMTSAISRKEPWTGNKLPSTKDLFGYVDIVHVTKIEDKMWKRVRYRKKPLVILECWMCERNRKVHTMGGYMLLRTRDLNQNVGYDVTYVEEMDVKMWMNGLFRNTLLQLFLGTKSRKESNRGVRYEI